MQEQTDLVQAMRRALVEPVAILVTVDKDGKPNAMSAGWNMKVSSEPPMLAVAVGESCYTRELIEQSGEFVLSIPTAGQEELLEYFGTVSGRDEDKIAKSGTKTTPASKIKTPLLADVRMNFECIVRGQTHLGDHIVYFGEIVAAHLDESKVQLAYKGKDLAGNRTYMSVEGYK